MASDRKFSQDRVLYQCDTCSFCLEQAAGDPPPAYCPNCKIHRMRGSMVPVIKPPAKTGKWKFGKAKAGS